MTDIVLMDPAEALERAADPGEFVVMALERGKSWLAEALAHGDLEALVNVKGAAETLRVAVMQKQLGKDAVLSAEELVRRAERCIGLGIRQGQEVGDISKGSPGPMRDYQRNGSIVHAGDRPANDSPISVESFGIRSDELSRKIYAVTDNVSDEQFEEAIKDGRADRNLSSANVVRKVKPDKTKPKDAGRSEWHRKARHIDAGRIIEETISTLEGLVLGLNLIDGLADAVDAEQRLLWAEALTQPLSDIKLFIRKELRG